MAKVEAGTVVGGKYRLDAPIGQGGMASVWRATHTTLESPVAVKFLDSYGNGRRQMADRFLREARIAASLKHRNVLHILDFGVLGEDDQPYMVMELLSGQSLGDRLEGDDPLEEIQLLEFTAQLLGGLAAVHDAGIVHRDVKPDNVFLVRDADGEYPKLLDFGISKSDASAHMTDTGAVVGTPAYMSPEQARGLKDLDHRTDLFSVGMILYEAFSGGLPFASENMGDILIRVATEDVPLLARVRPDLPNPVIEVVMKAVARDRSARWQDARSMRSGVLAAADALTRAKAPAGARLPSARHHETGPFVPGRVSMSPSVQVEAAKTPRSGAPRWLPYAFAGGFAVVLSLGAVVFAVSSGGGAPPATPVADVQPAEASIVPAAGPAPTEVAGELPTEVADPPPAAEITAPTEIVAPPTEVAVVEDAPVDPRAGQPRRVASSVVPRPTAAPPLVAVAPARTPVVTPPAATPAPSPAPTVAAPTPRPRTPRTPERPPAAAQGRGGFLRDLDY